MEESKALNLLVSVFMIKGSQFDLLNKSYYGGKFSRLYY